MSNETKNDEKNMEQINHLMAELETLQDNMTGYRSSYNALRQKKRELGESRRTLRQQRREADPDARANFDAAISELESELEQTEKDMDELEDDIARIEDDIEDIEEELEELQEEYMYKKKMGFQVVLGGKDIVQEIGRAMNKLTEIDVEELGENIGRSVDKMVTRVGVGINDVITNVKTSSTSENGDYFFAGASSLPSGDYGKLNFAGSGKIKGDITCLSLKASGAVYAEGDIICSGEVRSSGSVKCDGNLTGVSTKVSGSARIGGDLNGGSISVSGALTVGGGIKSHSLKTGGALTVGGDCESDKFVSYGRVEINGLLNSDTIDIHLDGASTSDISSIGCEKITVTRPTVTGAFTDLGFKSIGGRLNTETIEGDVIRLENTTAKTVRGRDVYIGCGCEVDTVEYTGKCEVSSNATVGDTKLV